MEAKHDKLRQYLNKQGISQSDAARRLGVTRSQVNALLCGKANFGRVQAAHWADTFGLSQAWLLTGEGDMLQHASSTEHDIHQTATGNAQNNVNGDNVHQGDTATLDALRAQLQRKDEQIAHLLDIISNLTKTC